MYKLIVAGGRDFDDYPYLCSELDDLLKDISEDICIVCGLARGADTLGETYAKDRGYSVDYYPADWKKYGKTAGFIRNEEMARNANALAAFWDGESRGTKDMITRAEYHGLDVHIFKYKKG